MRVLPEGNSVDLPPEVYIHLVSFVNFYRYILVRGNKPYCRPPKKYFLAAFQSYPRYAGPREAVFAAICRKNFGCSHFIVGRDHAARRRFEQLGPLGIQPIFFNEHAYSSKKRDYVDVTRHHAAEDILMMSGTEMRRMIQSGQHPPEWFMRQEVSRLIMDEIKRGTKVFVE